MIKSVDFTSEIIIHENRKDASKIHHGTGRNCVALLKKILGYMKLCRATQLHMLALETVFLKRHGLINKPKMINAPEGSI